MGQSEYEEESKLETIDEVNESKKCTQFPLLHLCNPHSSYGIPNNYSQAKTEDVGESSEVEFRRKGLQ
jgi:hypothetical protein